MLRIIRYLFATAAVLALLVAAAVGTLPHWLGPTLASVLPAGWHLDEISVVREARPLPTLRRLVLSVGDCRVLSLDEARVSLGWLGARPVLEGVQVDALTLDPACLPARGAPGTGLSALPNGVSLPLRGARLEVERLTVAGWLPRPHRLVVIAAADAVDGTLDGPVVRLAGGWGAASGIGIRVLEARQAELVTPALTVLRPSMGLESPARVDPRTGSVAAAVRLSADRVNLVAAGKLERPALRLEIRGTHDELDWTAEGTAAGGIGPVRGAGTWANGRLEGRASLPRQALAPLQSLLPPTLPIELQAGEVAAEADLTWGGDGAPGLGVEGELRVSDGRLGLTHAVADGVAVRLPFSHAGGHWRLGGRRAGEIRAATIAAAIDAEAATMRVAGGWPWSARDPLTIEDLRFRALGGDVSLDRLRLPQGRDPAVLRLRGIELERVSALYADARVSLVGVVEADLPLHLDDRTRLVTDGVVRNATPLRLRLTDQAALAVFKAGNPALAESTDWLSDLHVDRLEGAVNLQRDGTLILQATIEGRNPARGERSVRLNYRHEENLLHLLQSLRIGSDLSRGIEDRLSPRSRSGQ